MKKAESAQEWLLRLSSIVHMQAHELSPHQPHRTWMLEKTSSFPLDWLWYMSDGESMSCGPASRLRCSRGLAQCPPTCAKVPTRPCCSIQRVPDTVLPKWKVALELLVCGLDPKYTKAHPKLSFQSGDTRPSAFCGTLCWLNPLRSFPAVRPKDTHF